MVIHEFVACLADAVVAVRRGQDVTGPTTNGFRTKDAVQNAHNDFRADYNALVRLRGFLDGPLLAPAVPMSHAQVEALDRLLKAIDGPKGRALRKALGDDAAVLVGLRALVRDCICSWGGACEAYDDADRRPIAAEAAL